MQRGPRRLRLPTVALVAAGVAERITGDDFAGMVIYGVVFQVGAPLILTYLGVTAIHDEIADRSVVHLFVRPVSRVTLLLARWFAVAAVGAMLLVGVASVLFLAAWLPDVPWRHGLPPRPDVLLTFGRAALLAAPAYVAIGMLCGTFFRRPLIVAVAYVVASELIASNLPPHTGIRHLTVADPVRRFLFLDLDLAEGSRFGRMLTLTLRRFDPAEFSPPVTTVLWITGLSLGFAVWVYSRREYDSRPRD